MSTPKQNIVIQPFHNRNYVLEIVKIDCVWNKLNKYGSSTQQVESGERLGCNRLPYVGIDDEGVNDGRKGRFGSGSGSDAALAAG